MKTLTQIKILAQAIPTIRNTQMNREAGEMILSNLIY